MYALIDCNNFYVSCERVFQPKLRNKPGVVLSNNDGCTIARSQEAKDMGIKMGTPFFQIEAMQKEGKLWWRSSNYALYQDMMRRITYIVAQCWPEIEVYSIDESFCDLKAFTRFDLHAMAIELKRRIAQYTGVPVCIGIGPTRTLAKAANRVAKKHTADGVFMVDDELSRLLVLKKLPIEDVWGIGPRNSAKLMQVGISTAWDFAAINDYEYVEKRFTVTGLRTWYELRGTPCLKMEFVQPDKKGINTGRSFGVKTDDYRTIEDALCAFVQNSAPKLREQGSLCGRIQVFLMTSQFEVAHKRKSASWQMDIAIPTNITQELLRYAVSCLKRIYRPGFPYQKVGVYMTGFVPESGKQIYLLDDTAKRDRLTKVSRLADKLNDRFGKDTVRFAAMGYEQQWKMRQNFLSPRYTTRLGEVLKIGVHHVFIKKG
jgi:DNA polymerase V